MKIVDLLLFAYVIIISDTTFALCEYDGEPGCNSEIEMTRPWRNFCEPTKYWTCLCTSSNSCTAEIVSCSPGKGFMDSDKFGLFGCVPWDIYVWTTPKNPPTLP
ncbi:hypothetical protein ACFFRR_009828 [Megaselia abdita]